MSRPLKTLLIAAALLTGATTLNANPTDCTPRANQVWASSLQKYRTDPRVRHLVYVQCLEGSEARVQVYAKDDASTWTIVAECPALVGRCGTSQSKMEGDGCAPEGDFGILTAFGIKPNPGTALPYVDVTPDLYVSDVEGEYYNRIASTRDGAPAQGEHLWDYSPEYNYGLFLDYNRECVYPRGSAIFFHCTGPKLYTGGCVAVDESTMKSLIQRLTSGDRILIYPMTAQE